MLCVLAALAAPPADAGTTRSCDPVRDPYPNTRYEGVDLTGIRATGASAGASSGRADHAVT
jgi:hypothetical protein